MMRKLIATGNEWQQLQLELLQDVVKFFYRQGDWKYVEYTLKRIEQLKGE